MSSWSSSLPDVGVLGGGFDPARVEDAVREGYRAGFAAGEIDGRSAAIAAAGEEAAIAIAAERKQAAGLLLALRDELHRVHTAEAALRAELEVAVVDAALALAEAVIGRELSTAADPGRDALLRAFAVAPTGPDVVLVRMHPTDHARLGSLDDLALGREVTVVSDGSIEPGSCRVEVGSSTIDASIAAALDRAREVLSC